MTTYGVMLATLLGVAMTAWAQPAADRAASPGGSDAPGEVSRDPATKPTTRPQFRLTYSLSGGSQNWPADKREAIVRAMDEAVAIYNRHGSFDKHVTANYSPGTPTADANYDGWINFGGSISTRVALHEISHTLGVGTTRRWREMLVDGKWTGEHANALLREFDGPDAILKGDRQHFWPYGLNYDREAGGNAIERHVRLVEALRRDMGIQDSGNHR
jgi:hypothetical protein